jgi:hypothetical protein
LLFYSNILYKKEVLIYTIRLDQISELKVFIDNLSDMESLKYIKEYQSFLSDGDILDENLLNFLNNNQSYCDPKDYLSFTEYDKNKIDSILYSHNREIVNYSQLQDLFISDGLDRTYYGMKKLQIYIKNIKYKIIISLSIYKLIDDYFYIKLHLISDSDIDAYNRKNSKIFTYKIDQISGLKNFFNKII